MIDVVYISGTHFVTVVTYYPTFEDDTILATTIRIVATLILCMMMMTMIISVDSFTMAYLIMFKYKFITLRFYFEKLRQNFDKLNQIGYKKEAAEKLYRGLIEGVIMHSELLK